MEELRVTFTPASGDPPRVITVRIGTPVKGEHSWSTRTEVLGFAEEHAWITEGTDWAQVLELSAMVLPTVLHGMAKRAGGGTLDPYFYEREARPLSELPPELVAIYGAPAGK